MAGGEQQLLGLAGEGQSVFAKLQTSQVVLARCFELQFLDLADYPHTSKHVRLAAHGARTIHGDIVALFQRFSVTAKHIVHTLMPMLLEGIDLEEPSLVAGAFHEVLSCVTEMSSGANDVHSRYIKLDAEIGECYLKIADAETERAEANASQIKTLNEKLAAAKKDVIPLTEERAKCEEKKTDIKQQVAKINDDFEKQKEEGEVAKGQPVPCASDRAGATNDGNHQMPGKRSEQDYPAGGSYKEEKAVTNVQPKATQDRRQYYAGDQAVATKDQALEQCSEQVGPGVGGHNQDDAVGMGFEEVTRGIPEMDGMGGEGSKSGWSLTNPSSWFKEARAKLPDKIKEVRAKLPDIHVGETMTSMYNTLSGHGNSALEEEMRRQKLNLQKQMEETDAQMTDICSKIEAKNKHIRELEEQKRQKEAETPINAEGVRKAVNVMKDVKLPLSEICEFWTTMSQNIQPLADEQGASHVYRSAIEDESVKSTFLKKMSLTQQGWERLDALCMDYVRHFQQDPVESLGRIFAFLSAPIGQPREVIVTRTSELRKSLRQ